jgi:hypothetical protein
MKELKGNHAEDRTTNPLRSPYSVSNLKVFQEVFNPQSSDPRVALFTPTQWEL